MAEKRQHMFDVKSDPSRPTVRSASIRKSAKDGGLTPTEQAKKSRLMRQFSARNKGYAVAISDEYRDGYDAIDWGKG